MAEIIQFNCPVCGILLKLPLSMAAQQGPCPHCESEIIAPDPQWGIGAHEVAIAEPMPTPEPFQPFLEVAPPAETSDEPVPDPSAEPELGEVMDEPPVATPLTPTPRAKAASSRPWVLVLSCLLTGTVAMVWGYALGVRAHASLPQKPASISVPERPSEILPPVVAPVPVELPVEPPLPTPEIAPSLPQATQEAPAEPKQVVSAAAEASLRAFLEAPDWAARLAHVLQPEKMRDAMEAYSHEVPDGPTPFQSIVVKQSHLDEKTGLTLYLFYVITADFPSGIPVAVQETTTGWLVDWQAFVEFRDGLFRKFADGPVERAGRFHLAVTAPPTDRAAATANEHFTSYLLQSPLAKSAQLAYVRNGSDTATTLQTATSGATPFTPVLEVVKRQTQEGQSYLEIVKIVATNWLPTDG